MGDQFENQDTEESPELHVSAGGQIYADTGIWTSLSSGLTFLSRYGWYLLIGAVVLLYLWNRYKSNYYNWRKKREEWLGEQNFDPVRAEQYEEAMMRSREKMQRKLEQETQEHMTKLEERKQKEQDERIKQWEEFKVINKSKAKQESHPRRGGYSPLGESGGGGYRPQRRQVSGGG